jgi:hypothetical protein
MRTRILQFLAVAVLAAGVVAVAPSANAAVAPIRVVRHTSATTGSGTAGSLGATFARPTKTHDLIVIAVTTDGGVSDGALSVTDSAGNSWVQAVQTGFVMETEFWYAKDAQSMTSLTITWATFVGHVMLDAYEVAGADRDGPLAGFSTGTQDTSSTICETSIDPGPANYLVIGMASGNAPQPMAMSRPGYRATKQLAASSTVMRSGSMAPSNGLTTFGATWATPMACSALSVAFKPRSP